MVAELISFEHLPQAYHFEALRIQDGQKYENRVYKMILVNSTGYITTPLRGSEVLILMRKGYDLAYFTTTSDGQEYFTIRWPV